MAWIPEIPDPVESADTLWPGSLSYSYNNGKGVGRYFLTGIDSREELRRRVLGIIGYNAEGDDGRIRRVLPRYFPKDPALFASSIALAGRPSREQASNYVAPSAIRSSDDPGEMNLADFAAWLVDQAKDLPRPIRPSPIASEFALYPEYEATVEFLQRPYHVLPDDDIPVLQSKWYDEAGNEVNYFYAEEWRRFVEIDGEYNPKILTATQGQLTFRTGDGTAPHSAAFAGSPRLPFPESTLHLIWHQVPRRYVSSRNSYLERFANYVNQATFEVQDYSFAPGELLYLGFSKPTRYTPPLPFYDLTTDDYALEKWVDLVLHFGVARRASTSTPPQLLNRNWVTRGWNVLPWFGVGWQANRGYHYVASFSPLDPDNPRYWAPLFLSAPFELLFTDPDVPQPQPAP